MASIGYQKLRGDEIRLLELVSASSWQFRLLNVSLNSYPRYTALSYTWGDAYSPEPILLDDQEFWVTENLKNALSRLRYDCKTPYLWVDAICINQQDDLEKNFQVPMMRQIYERSTSVVVWLGTSDDHKTTELAFRKIEYFHGLKLSNMTNTMRPRRWWPLRKPNSPNHSYSSMLAQLSPSDREVFDKPGSPTYQAWQGICLVLGSPWWGRTWICQESTVPEPRHFILKNSMATPPLAKVEFWFGTFTTTWAKLINVADVGDFLGEHIELDTRFMESFQANFRRVMSIRALRAQNWELDPLNIIQVFQNTNCSNQRDKLYAPLCLAPQSMQNFIKPDYGKTVPEVYTDLVKYYLAQSQLDFLGLITKPSQFEAVGVSLRWPSWLPDLRERRQCQPLGKKLYIFKQSQQVVGNVRYVDGLAFNGTITKVYNASKDSTVSASLRGSNLSVLQVRGFSLDIVTEILPLRGVEDQVLQTQILSLCDPSGRGNYMTGESFQQVLLRIQSADVEYDFYERICRRGVGINPDILRSHTGQMKPQTIMDYKNFKTARIYAVAGRSICRTSRGYLGLMHETSKVGDKIFVFLGSQVLYSLRSTSSDDEFEYIGECYLHGMMDGEAIDWLKRGNGSTTTINLV